MEDPIKGITEGRPRSATGRSSNHGDAKTAAGTGYRADTTNSGAEPYKNWYTSEQLIRDGFLHMTILYGIWWVIAALLYFMCIRLELEKRAS